MSIIRVKKDRNNPYLIMNKTVLEDKRLSLKAKGLCCYLLSKPDNWYVNTNEIVLNSSNGLKSIWSAIKELIKYGYMYKHQFRSDNGQFHSYNYLIFEKPESPESKKSITSPNRPFGSSDNRSSDKDILLINKTKLNNKTLLTTFSNKSNNVNDAQDNLLSKEQRTETIKLLNELHIKNHKILFDTFDNIDIFWCSDWMLTFKSSIKNPTGFMIAALKGKWLDVDNYLKIQYKVDKDSV
ncbi:MAG: hypothetical protein GH151_04190 [Bacteroidetes bacterium]|nr:hypothetical protein [Bacteroidota bacterium]